MSPLEKTEADGVAMRACGTAAKGLKEKNRQRGKANVQGWVVLFSEIVKETNQGQQHGGRKNSRL